MTRVSSGHPQAPTPDAQLRRASGGFYRGSLLPRFLGWSESIPSLDAARQRAVEYATGHVLELGSGLGSTLDLYPHEITSLTAVEPNPALNTLLRRRMRHLPFPIDVREGSAERLPVKEAAFDCVVSTFTLGAVGDRASALAEVRRVLKPGGRLLLAELGFDEDTRQARRQQRLAGVRSFFSGGYRLVTDLEADLQTAGLRIQRLEFSRLPEFPKLLGTLAEALAVREP